MSAKVQSKRLAGSLLRQSFSGREPERNEFVFSRRTVIIIASFTLLCLLHVWSRLYIVDTNLKISAAKQTRRELSQEVQRLRVEVISLKNPQRIESFAKNELEMVAPNGQQVIIVNDERSSAGSAVADRAPLPAR